MKLLIDMNLSPDWVAALQQHAWEAVHWSLAGDPRATDREIMEWARKNGFVVFTHDLDFGTILALTHAVGPSVIQLRAQNVLPADLSPLVTAAIQQHDAEIAAGALVVIEKARKRVRILPL